MASPPIRIANLSWTQSTIHPWTQSPQDLKSLDSSTLQLRTANTCMLTRHSALCQINKSIEPVRTQKISNHLKSTCCVVVKVDMVARAGMQSRKELCILVQGPRRLVEDAATQTAADDVVQFARDCLKMLAQLPKIFGRVDPRMSLSSLQIILNQQSLTNTGPVKLLASIGPLSKVKNSVTANGAFAASTKSAVALSKLGCLK
jgi:hypothetical protein